MPQIAPAPPVRSRLRFTLLDPLRGLAALWVFLFHYPFSYAFRDGYPGLHQLTRGGDYAVPLFFVISGYCILLSAHQSLERCDGSWEFWKRRCGRILPTFWCSIACILVLRLAVQAGHAGSTAPVHLRALPEYAPWEWLSVVTLTLSLVSDGAWWTRYGSINGAYWSLAIEVQFYLAVALALLTRRRLPWVIGLLTLISVVAHVVGPWRTMLVSRGLFLPFWSWFACGCGLYYLHAAGGTPERLLRRGLWGQLLLAGLLAAATLLGVYLLAVRGDRLLFCVAVTVVLWCALAIDPWVAWLVRSSASDRRSTGWLAPLLHGALRPWGWLGAMSYTLYLLHNELAYFLKSLVFEWIRVTPLLRDLLVVGLTVLACYPLYLLIERPFVRRRVAPSGGRRETPLQLGPAAGQLSGRTSESREPRSPALASLR